jgi:hypothetical protein
MRVPARHRVPPKLPNPLLLLLLLLLHLLLPALAGTGRTPLLLIMQQLLPWLLLLQPLQPLLTAGCCHCLQTHTNAVPACASHCCHSY